MRDAMRVTFAAVLLNLTRREGLAGMLGAGMGRQWRFSRVELLLRRPRYHRAQALTEDIGSVHGMDEGGGLEV